MTTTRDNFGPMSTMTIGSLHRFSFRKGWCNRGHLYQGNTERSVLNMIPIIRETYGLYHSSFKDEVILGALKKQQLIKFSTQLGLRSIL